MAITWHNIPITGMSNNSNNLHESTKPNEAHFQKQVGKQVTWSANLTDTKNVKPKHQIKSSTMKGGPQIKSVSRVDPCNHFICGVGQPCRLKSRGTSSTTNPKATVPPATTSTNIYSPPLKNLFSNQAMQTIFIFHFNCVDVKWLGAG